jgi:hypothetical protein
MVEHKNRSVEIEIYLGQKVGVAKRQDKFAAMKELQCDLPGAILFHRAYPDPVFSAM